MASRGDRGRNGRPRRRMVPECSPAAPNSAKPNSLRPDPSSPATPRTSQRRNSKETSRRRAVVIFFTSSSSSPAGPRTARADVEPGLAEKRAAEFLDPGCREIAVADDDILTDAEVRKQIELLVDDGDAQTTGVERARNRGWPAVDPDAPTVGPHRA